MAIFACVSAGAAVTQAIIYSKQSGIMKRNLEVTSVAANAAKDSVDTMKDTAEKQLRAYVSVNFTAPNQKDDFPKGFAVSITNNGQTPALQVLAVSNWRYWDGKFLQPSADFQYPVGNGANASIFTLGAQTSLTIEFPLIQTDEGVPFADFVKRANKEEITIFIYGTITYRDIFTDTPGRKTDFCFRHIPQKRGKPRQAMVCRVHNEAT